MRHVQKKNAKLMADTNEIERFAKISIPRMLSETHITNTPIDTKGFEKLVQVKENTVNDSFDLYSGLYIHNRFAKQQ
nr:arogenate dehydrogenase 1, chloroplastic-like [Tanacetum cinerariifolium]